MMNRRRGRAAPRRAASAAWAVGAAAVLMAPMVAMAPGAAAQPRAAAAGTVLAEESFGGGSTKPGEWTAPSPKGDHVPCLTAAKAEPPAGSLKACNEIKSGKEKADPDGKGVFRLTDESKQDAGGLVLNRPLDTRRGLLVDFDMYMYRKATPKAADGISFYLMDGAQAEATTGEPGGSLGYNGIKGAVIGFGFDQYGNFSTKTAGAVDKSEMVPNNVGVRGAESTKYKYVTGVKSPGALDAPAAKTRDEAKRHVSIAVSPKNVMSLSVDYGDGKGAQPLVNDFKLDEIKGQPKLPQTLRLGWAASTGNSTSVHEIGGFSARSLSPSLSVSVSGEKTIPLLGKGSVKLDVSNAGAASATDGVITASYNLAAGLKVESATGDGWDCKTAGEKVTCTRPGTGDGALEPGATAPPIDIKFAAGGTITGNIKGSAAVDTPGGVKGPGAVADWIVQILGGGPKPPAEGKKPSLGVAISNDGTPTPGGTTPHHLVVTNKADAGPTTGTVTATFTAPEGTTVKSATGSGWECETAELNVTCTRPGTGADALKPGKSYLPVDVQVTYPADAKGKVKLQGTVKTEGDADPSDDSTESAVTLDGPAAKTSTGLKLKVKATPKSYKPGEKFTYTVTVTNDGPDAAKGALLQVKLPEKWTKVPWACKATGDSKCPKPMVVDKEVLPLKGSINTTIDVAAGGTVVMQLTCHTPAGFDAPIAITANVQPPAGATNAECENGCTAKLESEKSTSWF